MLCNYGFAHIFNENGHYSLNGFPVIFKQRVIDCFKQDWHSSLDNNSVLLYFKQFKPDFGYAPYLDIVNFPTRKWLSKLRLSVLTIRIQTGRYDRNNTPIEQRICLFCTVPDIEDEFHFIVKLCCVEGPMEDRCTSNKHSR